MRFYYSNGTRTIVAYHQHARYHLQDVGGAHVGIYKTVGAMRKRLNSLISKNKLTKSWTS